MAAGSLVVCGAGACKDPARMRHGRPAAVAAGARGCRALRPAPVGVFLAGLWLPRCLLEAAVCTSVHTTPQPDRKPAGLRPVVD